MKLIYQTADQPAVVTVEPALLVVACDPRALTSVMDYSADELDVINQLENFTFYTTCLRVWRHGTQDKVSVLVPDNVEPQTGLVQAYRNETAKRWGLGAANEAETNIVTIYQMVGVDGDTDPGGLAAQREQFLNDPPSWWPFQPGRYEIVQVDEHQDGADHPAVNPLLTPYFNHFSSAALLDGAPWKWLDLQGNRNTVYVHASGCFESVLHCWSYLNILFDLKRVPLPQAKDGVITIIGAGVSGLLFAQRVIEMGYTNVTILEKTDRYAGKTHSIQVPEPDLNRTTIAEMGTCYLSPAYDDMVEALSKFTVGNDRVPIAHKGDQGVGVVDGSDSTPMSFDEYGLMIACQYLGFGWPCSDADQDLAKVELVAGAFNYVRLRHKIFGTFDGVMPTTRPDKLRDEDKYGDPYGIFSKTFLEFLEENFMGAFKGYLLYVYQVQGYGDLDKIPAYYGLVWTTPNIANPFCKSSGVTAWQNGWEDVWNQMVEKCHIDIQTSIEVLEVRR